MSSTVLDIDSAGCTLLGLPDGKPSQESVDYVTTKQQFQLHTLLTEQRHEKTMEMSQTIRKDAEAGLGQLLSVDDDITAKMDFLLSDAASFATITSLQSSILRTLRSHRQIYVYGCGATGRLAKLMESTFWRPFWRRMRASPYWSRISEHVSSTIDDSLIGEMTGADRALISSLEGFEDLLLIGELQLHDRDVKRGDLVIGVTEGGETSSVIGTVLAGLHQWNESGASEAEIKEHLFFVYNNPDHLLAPFHRSASVLNESRISKLNLATGPQAITGSTRMQATTSETFVIATALHCALDEFLRHTVGLNGDEMASIGFAGEPSTVRTKLREFAQILTSVKEATRDLSVFTRWESECYSKHHFTTYFAQAGLMTVFIDSTERSPTFRLFALDTTTQDQRKAWIQVWTDATDIESAWVSFLGRKFRGMEESQYLARFQSEIVDPYLKATALRSLPNAGNDQERLYDFSFGEENIKRRGGIAPGDVGCLTLMNENEYVLLRDPSSAPSRFIRLFTSTPTAADGLPTRVNVLIFHPNAQRDEVMKLFESQGLPTDRMNVAVFHNSTENDPLGIRPQMAMKIALNAHSTGVMSILGKVLGNCMVNVSPGNLKLIGRATYLILTHVNRACEKAGLPTVSYALTNAVLYDSIAVIKADLLKRGSDVPAASAGAQSAEVALSIIRMLQSIGDGAPLSGEAALNLLAEKGLEQFLIEFEAKHSK